MSQFSSVRLLPKDFAPSINEVVVGRGKKVTNHCGNRRFRELISTKIEEYVQAENKAVKSSIIFDVLQQVKQWSPATGGFVKQDAKAQRWFAVEDATARNTAAQAFRDASSSSYKSSKKAKQQRRLHRKLSSPGSVTGSEEEFDVLPLISVPPSVSVPIADVSDFNLNSISSLEGILDSALEMPFGEEDMGLSSSAFEPQKFITKAELDLEALWEVLKVPAATRANESPFEPTPIAPPLQQTPSVLPMPSLTSTFSSDFSKSDFHTSDPSPFSLQWAMSCRRM